jgi:hypothetical protein
MARRPEGRKDDVLTRAELLELQQRLARLSIVAVEDFYRSAHHRCSLQPRWLPSARSIQELVQAWKMLRKWRSK